MAEIAKREITKIVRSYDNSDILMRWIASFIDMVLLFLVIVTLDLLFATETLSTDLFIYSTLGWYFIYFPLTEFFFGQTIGKRIVRYEVVSANLSRPSFIQAYIRAFLRIIELNPVFFGGIPGGAVCLLSKHQQRLGDQLANTYVIASKDHMRISKHVQLVSKSK